MRFTSAVAATFAALSTLSRASPIETTTDIIERQSATDITSTITGLVTAIGGSSDPATAVANLAASIINSPDPASAAQVAYAAILSLFPTPTPGAPQCFFGFVLLGEPKLIGRVMDGHEHGDIHLHRDLRKADLWVIDPAGQMRLAFEPLSVVSRDEIGHKGVGPLETHTDLKHQEDYTVCKITKGVLTCQTKPGDVMLTHGHELWVGGAAPGAVFKRTSVAPVTIATLPIPCPPAF